MLSHKYQNCLQAKYKIRVVSNKLLKKTSMQELSAKKYFLNLCLLHTFTLIWLLNNERRQCKQLKQTLSKFSHRPPFTRTLI